MTELDRNIYRQLDDWKSSPNRKPLVVLGARQVGKTFALKRFAERRFEGLAYLDFSKDEAARSLFSGSIAPADLVPALELYLHMPIDPQNTLIVFDEAQACERSLTSLKYFCEDAPQYHVVAAGSLLGVKIRRGMEAFPVGKVDMLHLHPLNFEEYLWAVGERMLADAIRDAYATGTDAFALHDRAMRLVRDYELIGGMPEAVTTFVRLGSAGIDAFDRARAKQAEINVGYATDVVKYADEADAARILAALNSVPRQLAKENHKFQYKTIRSGARASQYDTAVDWIDAAGIALKCTRVSEGVAPLAAFEDEGAFKLYYADTGLLCARFEALPQDIEPAADKGAAFRGAVAENYVYQQIRAAGAAAHYWGTTSVAEVEFVARTRAGDIVPIEVKSGQNVTSKSLGTFVRAYDSPYAIRLSAKNFGQAGGIRSVPLYAAPCLAEELQPESRIA